MSRWPRAAYDTPEYKQLSEDWEEKRLWERYDFSHALKSLTLEREVTGSCPLGDGHKNCINSPSMSGCPIVKRGGVLAFSSRCGPLLIMRYGLKPNGGDTQ